jgi:hypothetical protein
MAGNDRCGWDDRRSPAQRWRDEWAERDAALSISHCGFVLPVAKVTLSRAQLRTLIRRRSWSAPRHGVVSPIHPAGDPLIAAALAATAAALVRTHAAICHESAAILRGLPVLLIPVQPTLTAPARSGTRDRLGLHLISLAAHEREYWYGAEVTSVARTVVDIARSSGRAAGLITADAALREGFTTIDALRDAVESATGRPGNLAARWVAEKADPLSESPLESVTRAVVLISGLPQPLLQAWIPAAEARVDLLFAEQRVVLEADGLLKYTDTSVLRAEKLRQERLEQAGYRVVRVTWSDVMRDQVRTVARINRALAAPTLRLKWSQ